MTIKEAITTIKAMGLRCKWIPETREFRINFLNGSEATAYYTDSVEDAIGTALQMKTQSGV
jgi:hypothetical protein